MRNAKRIATKLAEFAPQTMPGSAPRNEPDKCPNCGTMVARCPKCGLGLSWAVESGEKQATRPPLYDPREHPTQCESCGMTLPAGADPIDTGWTVGRKDGEFLCDECNANEGEARLSSNIPTIPDDGYADGGEPYTDEEMDIIEGTPTPPMASDMADKYGEAVQDCFGTWHAPHGKKGAVSRQRMAEESEGARREREIHELQQQYESPSYNKPMPSYDAKADAEFQDRTNDAIKTIYDILKENRLGSVMEMAWNDATTANAYRRISQFCQAIGGNLSQADKKWFLDLAGAMLVYSTATDAEKHG